MWGWLVLLAFVSLCVGVLIAAFVFNVDFPNRCNSNGECWGPW
jgi:hypothetical protein